MTGPCERCGCWSTLEMHHIIYRSQSVRLVKEPTNLMPLCKGCHDAAHKSKTIFFAWIDREWPGRLDALRALDRERSKKVAS